MVFCCIAMVGIAIIWFIVLWIRQLFSYPGRDPHHPSKLKPPPRALSGNGALPVYGHTRLFTKSAGDVALLFPPYWREVSCMPWTRTLGECFAIFIWGQWRVVIKGPHNAAKVMNGQTLKQGWPWNPPVTLLGKSCLALLPEGEEAEELYRILQRPLSHSSVLSYAPALAEAAERCLQQVQQGDFSSKPQHSVQRASLHRDKSTLSFGSPGEDSNHVEEDAAAHEEPHNNKNNSNNNNNNTTLHKVKWEALRSYTLDIVDGPLFKMNFWKSSDDATVKTTSTNGSAGSTSTTATTTTATTPKNNKHPLEVANGGKDEESLQETDLFATTATTTTTGTTIETDVTQHSSNNATNKQLPNGAAAADDDEQIRNENENKKPSREHMLLWMERLKFGIDVIKITFGPEWMYVWICNEYGRAVNARMYLDKYLSRHVKAMEALVPVPRRHGYSFHEPTTQPFPLLTLGRNIYHSGDGIFGNRSASWKETVRRPATRQRSNTLPNLVPYDEDGDELYESERTTPSSPRVEAALAVNKDYVTPFETEQDLARPKYHQEICSPSQTSTRYLRKEKMSPDMTMELLLSPGTSNRLRDEITVPTLDSSGKLNTQTIQPPLEPMVSPTRRKMIRELSVGTANSDKSHDPPKQSSLLESHLAAARQASVKSISVRSVSPRRSRSARKLSPARQTTSSSSHLSPKGSTSSLLLSSSSSSPRQSPSGVSTEPSIRKTVAQSAVEVSLEVNESTQKSTERALSDRSLATSNDESSKRSVTSESKSPTQASGRTKRFVRSPRKNRLPPISPGKEDTAAVGNTESSLPAVVLPAPPLASPGSLVRRKRSSSRRRLSNGSPSRRRMSNGSSARSIGSSSMKAAPSLDAPAESSSSKRVSINLSEQSDSRNRARSESLPGLQPQMIANGDALSTPRTTRSPRVSRRRKVSPTSSTKRKASSRSLGGDPSPTPKRSPLRPRQRSNSPRRRDRLNSRKERSRRALRKPPSSLLERLLRQKGPEEKGISETNMTELLINLWMILDVGNAWTAMALHLLSGDRVACALVQDEIDGLRLKYGDDLFSPVALRQMRFLDALIYESIRLTPPFLGGLKQTTETVELESAGVQVAKGSHVFFCQPSQMNFNIHKALGQQPETLGKRYPCVELYGFLPMQGLEVPLMVLQSKVFLAATLQKFSPFVSKRKTFIRRVRHTFKEMGVSRQNLRAQDRGTTLETIDGNDSSSVEVSSTDMDWLDLEEGNALASDMTPTEAMRLFTKIPFPEPKRVIKLRKRPETGDRDSD